VPGSRSRNAGPRFEHRQQHGEPPAVPADDGAPGRAAGVGREQGLDLHQYRAGAFQAGEHRAAGYVASALGEEKRGGVGDFGEAGLGHLEHADFVGGAEAVLDGAQDAELVAAVAFEVEHGVDHVLQNARAGEAAVLGHVADQDQGEFAGFSEPDQFETAGSDLRDGAGGAFDGIEPVVFRRLRDTNLEITASFLVTWASYLAAEAVGVSGVLATTTCGLLMGWYQHETFSAGTRLQAKAAWRVAVFVLEALLFILVGLSLRGLSVRFDAHTVTTLLPLALLISFAVIAVRMVWVFPATYLSRLLVPAIRRTEPRPAPSVPTVIGWAGMRGAVSLAAALALPIDFPGRDPILLITFTVILVTLLIQGGSLGILIQALGLSTSADNNAAQEYAQPRAAIAAAALRVVEERETDPLYGAIAEDMVREYRDRAGWLNRVKTHDAAVHAEIVARLSLRREALAAARSELLRLHRSGDIGDDALNALEQELDLDEIRLPSAN
jgi:sodium/hydrogen exchanger family protein